MSTSSFAGTPDLSSAGDAALHLHQRYREDVAAATGHSNPVLATLLAHRSVRAYLPEPLAKGTLELLVAAASSASTSSNLQCWSVVAVEDQGRKDRLADLAGGQRHIRECPTFLVWLADLARLGEVGAERGAELESLPYLESFLVAVIDAALAAQNAVAAAESLGLGVVYIGGMRNHPEKAAAELGLPPRVMPLFGLCLGYPDPAKPTSVKPRLPQAAVLHREQYSWDRQRAAVARYDGNLRAFQEEQGMAPVAWTGQIVNRVRSAKALNGRDRLRQALAKLGFELR